MLSTGFFVAILTLIVLVYSGVGLYLMFSETRMVYSPEHRLIASPERVGLPYEDVYIETDDGIRLHGWYVPSQEQRGVILFFHGNTGNISHRFETLETFYRFGYDTFILDYRGYGRSGGTPSEDGTYRDADAAWRFLTEVRGIDRGRIVVIGRSLGGAIATWLASRVEPAALVVESSFTSIPELAQAIYPWLPVKWLARIRYNSLARMASIRCPLLVVHSRNDELIPFVHGQALHDAYGGHDRTLLAIRGHHNDGFVTSGELYQEGLRQFLYRVTASAEHGTDAARAARQIS